MKVNVSQSRSGDLTAAGDKFFDAGAITPITDPSSDTLTLKAHEAGATDRTFSGDAFWSRVEINCAVNQLVTASIDFQGTGSWSVT